MTTYSQIVDNVMGIVRDTSTGTQTIIERYVKEVMQDLMNDIKFPELLTQLDITSGTGNAVEFSATTAFKTYNILDLLDVTYNKRIPIISKRLIDESQPDQSNSTGYPNYAALKSDHALYIYPYGSSTVLTVNYYSDPTGFSSYANTMAVGKEAEKVLENGIISEVMLYKGDDRATLYEAKYQTGKQKLRVKYGYSNDNESMLPGHNRPNISNEDWMLN